MKNTFKHLDTGKTRNLKVGWSWTLLFFSSFYGIPLFLRGLKSWGWLMFIVGILAVIRNFVSPIISFLDYVLIAFLTVTSIFFGFKGNALTLKQWLKNGWVLVDNQAQYDDLIHFRCPSCQIKYTAIPQQAAKQGTCKNCGARIVVPKKGVIDKPKTKNVQQTRKWYKLIALIKPAPEVVQLRSEVIENLRMDDVKEMVIRNDFYDLNISRLGQGIQHDYELVNSELVIDHITGLTWQQSGSNKNMTFEDAKKYVQELNNKKYAGYSDWRLPTLEEAMSLLENKNTTFKRGKKFLKVLNNKKYAGHSNWQPTPEVAMVMMLHIDPIFDRKQWMIWTTDKEAPSSAWALSFDHGCCHSNDVDHYRYKARAVRS